MNLIAPDYWEDVSQLLVDKREFQDSKSLTWLCGVSDWFLYKQSVLYCTPVLKIYIRFLSSNFLGFELAHTIQCVHILVCGRGSKIIF